MKKSIGAGTIAQPTPTWVVGAYAESGKPNFMTAAWAGICCSKPPCLAVSLRAATYTHGLIMGRQAFTVSIASEAHVREVDYLGIVSGRGHDKLAETGLTAARGEVVDAPFVAEFPLVIECRVAHVHELGLHTQFVGEIMNVLVDEDCLSDTGMPMIEKIRPIIFDPGNGVYNSIGPVLGKAFSIGKEIKRAR